MQAGLAAFGEALAGGWACRDLFDLVRAISRDTGAYIATVKKSPPTFVQAGPMDPWALMQKALLDALVHQK